jgi:hypothetical protein
MLDAGLVGLRFSPEDGGSMYVIPKHRLTIDGLHGVMAHEADLFMTTAVKTSNSAMQDMGFPNPEKDGLVPLRLVTRYKTNSVAFSPDRANAHCLRS